MYTCMLGKAISELSLSETRSMVELRHSKRTDETQSDPHEGVERGNTLQSSKVLVLWFCFVWVFLSFPDRVRALAVFLCEPS